MPISKIVQQYLDYIEVLKELDLGDVGDFVDLAARSLSSKAKRAQNWEETEDEEIIESQNWWNGARYEEIRDAAAVLDEMGTRWQQRYERLSDDLPARRLDLGDQPLADLEIWDLVSAFGRIMREASGPPATEVVYDDTPIHVYMQQIHHRLRDENRVPLMDMVTGGIHKSSLIGWFLATLELTRHHGAAVEQDTHGDIFVVRTQLYSENLNVNEVDNYDASEFQAVNMPGQPR